MSFAPGDIGGVITDGVIMPHTVPREFIAAQFGMTRSFDGGVSFGGAGVACAPELAKLAISAGKAQTVLFYFGVDWGSRVSGPYGSLLVKSRINDRIYAKGRRVSDQELAQVHLEPHDFHGEWNYALHPTAPHDKPIC